MQHSRAFAAYAAGLAMLRPDRSAVDELIRLADGDSTGLHDARELLRAIDTDPARAQHADLLLVRAITRVEYEGHRRTG